MQWTAGNNQSHRDQFAILFRELRSNRSLGVDKMTLTVMVLTSNSDKADLPSGTVADCYKVTMADN